MFTDFKCFQISNGQISDPHCIHFIVLVFFCIFGPLVILRSSAFYFCGPLDSVYGPSSDFSGGLRNSELMIFPNFKLQA